MHQPRPPSLRRAALAALPIILLPVLAPVLAASPGDEEPTAFEGSRGILMPPEPPSASVEAMPTVAPREAEALAEEPPARVGRIARVQGAVAFRAAPEDGWTPALANTAIVAGNAVFTEPGARAAIEIDQISIAIEAESDVQIARLDDSGLVLTLPRGALYLTVAGLLEGETVAVVTPLGSMTTARDGRYQIDGGMPADAPGGFRPGRFAVLAGAAVVSQNGVDQPLGPDQAVTMTMRGPVLGRAAAASPLIAWAGATVGKPAPPPPAVARGMTGAEQLGRYGRWDTSAEYGDIWFPEVDASYVPYREGRWVWRHPWGWTWVDDRPWGFAPFHYGRWVQIGPRWGWAPRPVAFEEGWRPRRPVWAPALVAFVGVAAQGNRGPGVGWVPLGPREAYFPAFRASPGYVRNVNVFAIRDPRAAEGRWREWRREQPGAVGPRGGVFASPAGAFSAPPVNRAAFSAMPAAAMTASQSTRGVALPLAVPATATPRMAPPPPPSGQTFGVTPVVAGRIGLPAGTVTATPQRLGPPPQTHAPLMAGAVPLPGSGAPRAAGAIAPTGSLGSVAPPASPPVAPGGIGPGLAGAAAAGAAAGVGAAALLGRPGSAGAASRPGVVPPSGGVPPMAGAAGPGAIPGRQSFGAVPPGSNAAPPAFATPGAPSARQSSGGDAVGAGAIPRTGGVGTPARPGAPIPGVDAPGSARAGITSGGIQGSGIPAQTGGRAPGPPGPGTVPPAASPSGRFAPPGASVGGGNVLVPPGMRPSDLDRQRVAPAVAVPGGKPETPGAPGVAPQAGAVRAQPGFAPVPPTRFAPPPVTGGLPAGPIRPQPNTVSPQMGFAPASQPRFEPPPTRPGVPAGLARPQPSVAAPQPGFTAMPQPRAAPPPGNPAPMIRPQPSVAPMPAPSYRPAPAAVPSFSPPPSAPAVRQAPPPPPPVAARPSPPPPSAPQPQRRPGEPQR